MGYRAALFDLDGTLLDSMGMWAEIDARSLGARGIHPVPPDYQQAVAAMRIDEAAIYTITRFGLSDSPESLRAEWLDMARREYESSICLKPHALSLLKALRARGILIGTVSTLTRDQFEPPLRRGGAYELFDAFTSASEAPRGKAYPDAYLIAAGRLGVSPDECIMYDDMPEALGGARAAGMFTVGVSDPHARVTRQELCLAAHRCIDDLAGEAARWAEGREGIAD